MAERAKTIMEGLQGEAKQRLMLATAEKEDDPIYGFIANMGSMNKQVRGRGSNINFEHYLLQFIGLSFLQCPDGRDQSVSLP